MVASEFAFGSRMYSNGFAISVSTSERIVILSESVLPVNHAAMASLSFASRMCVISWGSGSSWHWKPFRVCDALDSGRRRRR